MDRVQYETTAACSGPELWDAKRTARALGISERALWDLTAPRGQLACVRLGRAVRYSPERVRVFIESQTIGATA